MAKIKKRETLSEIFAGIAAGTSGVYVFLMFTLFPLYTHDMYFDILGMRYGVYLWISRVFVAFLIFLGGAYFFIDYSENVSSPPAIKRFILAFHPKNIRKYISITDICFFVMILSMTISTLGTYWKEEAFYGNAGRYQGLECWLTYFLAYLGVSKTFRFKKFYLDWAILAGCFACIWAMLDFFQLDPFGFFRNVGDIQKGMFTSSVGNLNTFTNYSIMMFAVSASMFLVEKNRYKLIFYGVTTLITCAGTMFGLADNSVIGFAAIFVVLPFIALDTRRSLLRYVILIDIFFLSILIFRIACNFPHNSWQDSFFMDLSVNKINVLFVLLPLIALTVALYFYLNKLNPNYGDGVSSGLTPLDSLMPSGFKKVYSIIVILLFLFGLYIVLDVNIFKQRDETWLKLPAAGQLIINDDWGTHRGHNWRIAFTNFTQNFSWFQRLFGYGPDTYLIVSERTFYEEMVNRYHEVYDSAHNEYINYLICEGLIGLIAYLGIFISAMKNGIKNLSKNPFILAPVMAVLAYMAQAVVNIAIPITTPVFFTLMYMCAAENVKESYLQIDAQ